ncbi:hypothetical protein FRB96_003191 [Tulasnella sp. 330]|nr:hypothetical protein FRB96_003191 [Tulasnella sp. 330]KAG8884322.1 hypothetical protein FRB97_004586 [Tulasnella sp. 331]
MDYTMGYFLYNDKLFEEHIWDSSGKEQYDDVRRKYYKGIRVVWVVYDVTNRQSFENIRVWVASIRRFATDIPPGIYLFGCKTDLDDQRAV